MPRSIFAGYLKMVSLHRKKPHEGTALCHHSKEPQSHVTGRHRKGMVPCNGAREKGIGKGTCQTRTVLATRA